MFSASSCLLEDGGPSFWYFQALDSLSALPAVFIDQIQPKFAKLCSDARREASRVLMQYWDRDAPQFIASKVVEQAQYSDRLRDMFANHQIDPETGLPHWV